MNHFVHFRKNAQDLVGCQERHSKYRGSACVDISHLRIDRRQHELDHEHVEKLKESFRNEGCHRLNPANRIAALVSQEELDTLLLCSGLSHSTLLQGAITADQPPKLTLSERATLRVLHGHHRLEAARSFLPLDDAWWTIDLFLDDMSSVLTTGLRKEYSEPKAYSDGEIFRKIRLCHQQERIYQEMRWWAYLTKDKVRDLRSILAVKEFREGFDNLLDLTGLWDGFCIESLQRCLTLKCNEVANSILKKTVGADIRQELSTYLRHIRHVWATITGSETRLMNLVDVVTVTNLELRAPAASDRDATFVRTCMDNGKIFGQVLDPIRRGVIINKICAIEKVIPSIKTFFEDVMYLGPCATAIQMALDLVDKKTIYETLRANFTGCRQDRQRLDRQDGENCFVEIEKGEMDCFEFNYRQLWIFAMRHFPDLLDFSVRQGSCLQKPVSVLWYRFARLALKLGFRSDSIEQMASVSALDEAVSECISWIANATKTGESLDRQVAEVRTRLQIEMDAPPEMAPLLATEDRDLDVRRPGGRPLKAPRHELKKNFYIRWLYDLEKPRGRYVTPFFVNKARFQAFFGESLQSRDSRTVENCPKGSENPFPTTTTSVKSPPHLSDICSPRKVRKARQQSLAEVIMVPRDSTWLENRNSQSGVGVEETFGSPVTCQAQTTMTAAEFPSQQLAIPLDSIISQSTTFHGIQNEPSSLEAGVKASTKPDEENEPLANLTPVPYMSPSSDATAPTSVTHLSSNNLTLATSERGSVTPDHPASSPDSIYAEHDQEIIKGIKKNALKLDTATTSTSILPRSSRICISKVQSRPSEFTPATRRICEILTESQSCSHDSITHLVNLGGRKNMKRNFWEYSLGINDLDDGRIVSDTDGHGDQMMKRRRISKS